MPKISEIFSSRYLKVEHLNNKPLITIIESWEQEEAYGEQQYVVYFEGERRGLRLNATNAKDIAKLHGDDMGKWSGEKIELYPAKQEITDKETKKKKIIDIIRARAPGADPVNKTIAPPAKTSLDDDIPL